MILDTNALSAWAEGDIGLRPPLLSAHRLLLPSIVLGEYYFGIRQSQHRKRYEAWLARNVPHTEVAAVTSATADRYAEIRIELQRIGNPIPQNDTWIAALARQHDLAILSNDRHFDVVPGVQRIGF